MSAEGNIRGLRDILLKERNALLDLSTRNRLLNIPLKTKHARLIEVVDEKTSEIRRLLDQGKSLSFLPGRLLNAEERETLEADDDEAGAIPQPGDDELDERGVARRHTDLFLQTRLTSEGLQKRLFDIWYDARTLEEEQGVNILFLAMGLLRWYEADNSEIARHAPLVLIPVSLERTSASEKFKLKARGEPLSTNITLQAKLKAEFGLLLEDSDVDDEDFDLAAYFAKVAETVTKQPRWEVLPDAMVLGFFSFAKFLMYRDLDPALWPQGGAIDEHPLISALLRDGFPQTEPLIADESAPIDPVIPPIALNHIVDADSSQAVAIEEAANGRTLVVKGPPGTGKSQTITNIIAAAVARGKKVLFVAEKMAALDVVYRRLKQAGLGALALELHSNKVNKRQVLEELRRTEGLVPKAPRGEATTIELLGKSRDQLNAHAARLHLPMLPPGYTPYQLIGHCLRTRGSVREDIVLSKASRWTPTERRARDEILRDIQDRLIHIGIPKDHVWYGVECAPIDPIEAERLPRKIRSLQDQLAVLVDAASIVFQSLGGDGITSLSTLTTARRMAEVSVGMPEVADRACFSHPLWESDPQSLKLLIAAGRDYETKRGAADASFRSAMWTTDFSPIHRKLVEKGSSLFRIFDSEYRSRLTQLRTLVANLLPRKLSERLALIDEATGAQAAKAKYENLCGAGPAFGGSWKGPDSVWDTLDTIVTWRLAQPRMPSGFYSRLSSADGEVIASAHQSLEKSIPVFLKELSDLVAELNLDLRKTFELEQIEEIGCEVLKMRFDAWLTAPQSLSRWILFAGKCREAEALDLGPLITAAARGSLPGNVLFTTWEASYFDELRNALFREMPELRAFDGEAHGRLVTSFQQLDNARIELAREQIASQHAEGRPKGMALGDSPLGVLKGEMAKKSRHLPIRKLLDKAGPAIQQLKPVFMMSPLSVAQFLKPGRLHFDLLLMDEASQIEPVDALGAIARVRQIVVVGDERQLPPTRFFAKLTSDVEERDEDSPTFDAKDVESILELCLAKGAPHRMLNWHYRSKHQSLIAVSNREFYENKLFIVPSPYDATAGMGLKLHYLPDARYERGESRTNPKEAKAVAEAVIAHARDCPDLSLGVAAFSVAQRGAILKELEILRRASPDAEPFFTQHPNEPFFVKNLENIQGDERDVIFISVGYGKNENGYMAMNFGPLSSDGGERRLNVLISRAKTRCEVFTSITADDIDLERGRSRGVAAFKLFLAFAQTGKFGFEDVTGNDPDSVFEEQVAEKLKSLGYDVRSQIGTAGFFVDLAISDPDKPGRFVLGIECDGAQYHSSRSARDRDRLRQQVLEAHNWIIHRIWSTDWYLRPDEEIRKVQASIENAKSMWRERDDEVSKPKRAVPISIDVEAVNAYEDEFTVAVGGARTSESLSTPYLEAMFGVNHSLEPHEVPIADMVASVIRVVDIEGPIHADEVVQRIRNLWGLGRAGSRIRATVQRAVDIARRQGLIIGDPFLICPNRTPTIRDRSQVASPTLRKPDYLPPAEIDEAILKLVAANFGASRDGLVVGTARLFGFASTSNGLKAVLEDRIDGLVQAGKLSAKDDFIVHPE